MSRLRALIIDDVVDMAETIARDLQAAGYDTEVARGGAEALDAFARLAARGASPTVAALADALQLQTKRPRCLADPDRRPASDQRQMTESSPSQHNSR